MKITFSFLIIIVLSLTTCKKDNTVSSDLDQELTIFFMNDLHGQIDNFSKVKYIIDEEKENTDVLVVCAGDIFSGNPVVDIYEPQGYPMIDLLNEIGTDVMAIGNHEFDYGEETFRDRVEQSDFPWICANIDPGTSVISDPPEYVTLNIGELKITVIGFIETNGKPNDIIPSTHPWKVENIEFTQAENVIAQYQNLKTEEDADLFIALTHLGLYNYRDDILGDDQLAHQFPYFDLIIGGHTNELLDTTINNIPVLIANKYLNYLGRTRIQIKDKKIVSMQTEHIDLTSYTLYDVDLQSKIDAYHTTMSYLQDIIGNSEIDHDKYQTGCFYVDALREYMNVDLTFQNPGGVRAGLDQGSISIADIYSIEPFNNGTVIYEMTVSDIKEFLIGSGSGFYYSGVILDNTGGELLFRDTEGNLLEDTHVLTVGINDYIPAVYDNLFPLNGETQILTAAETMIQYLSETSINVNYPVCDCYFYYE